MIPSKLFYSKKKPTARFTTLNEANRYALAGGNIRSIVILPPNTDGNDPVSDTENIPEDIGQADFDFEPAG